MPKILMMVPRMAVLLNMFSSYYQWYFPSWPSWTEPPVFGCSGACGGGAACCTGGWLTGAGEGGVTCCAGAGVGWTGSTGVPHFAQKRESSGSCAPQFLQKLIVQSWFGL